MCSSDLMGIEPVEHVVRPKPLLRDRVVTGGGEATVDLGEAGRARDEQREAVGKCVFGVDRAAPAFVGQAFLFRVETNQAQRAAEEVAEPLRAQTAHVIGGDFIVPHGRAGRRLDSVELDMQRQLEIGRAS